MPPGSHGKTRAAGIAPPVVPGAILTKPSVSRRNGRSCVTPVARVAPGEMGPCREGQARNGERGRAVAFPL